MNQLPRFDIESGTSTPSTPTHELFFTLVGRPSSVKLERAPAKTIPTILCSICMENVVEKDCLYSCSNFRAHRYCKACLSSWCQSQINDGVIRLHCPGYQQCHQEIYDGIIDDVLDEQFKERLSHLRLLKTDPSYRECPR